MREQGKRHMFKVFGFTLITTCVLPASTEYLKLDGSNAMTGPLVVNSTATIAGNAFSVGGSTIVVRGGHVGVGMAPEHPALRMEVLGIIKSSGSANSLMFSDRANSANSFEWYSSGNVARLYSSISARDTIALTTDGKVGIGTTAPTKKLQIHSTSADTHLKISGTGPGIFLSDAEGNPTSSFGVYSMATSAGQYGSLNAGDLVIAANHDVYITANYQAAGKNLLLQPASGPSPSGGNVGIGTVSPGATLDIAGNLRASSLAGTGNRAVYSDASGTLTNSASDSRLKKKIVPLSSSATLKQILQLRPVSFYWDTSIKRAENLGRQQEIGLVAQEVASIVPQVVGENADGYKSLDYAKLVPILIGAVQAQQEYIKALEKRISALEGQSRQ